MWWCDAHDFSLPISQSHQTNRMDRTIWWITLYHNIDNGTDHSSNSSSSSNRSNSTTLTMHTMNFQQNHQQKLQHIFTCSNKKTITHNIKSKSCQSDVDAVNEHFLLILISFFLRALNFSCFKPADFMLIFVFVEKVQKCIHLLIGQQIGQSHWHNHGAHFHWYVEWWDRRRRHHHHRHLSRCQCYRHHHNFSIVKITGDHHHIQTHIQTRIQTRINSIEIIPEMLESVSIIRATFAATVAVAEAMAMLSCGSWTKSIVKFNRYNRRLLCWDSS